MSSRQIVEAPQLVIPRYGIVAAAALVDDGARWGDGVQYSPEGCAVGGATQADCTPGEGELGTAPDAEAELGFDSFELWGADECSGLQGGRDYVGRAQRALAATRSFQIAHELWAGTLTQARHADAGDRSPYLTDGDATSVGSHVGMAAVVRADAEFATCSQGRRAMIHLTPYALGVAMLAGSDYIYRDGSLLLTQLGSIVVPDAGYGSSATDLGVHATPLVSLRLGPVKVTPASNDPAELAAALNRSTNVMTAWAQQPALYQFDADCCRKVATMTTS